jgi:hypothetical protein
VLLNFAAQELEQNFRFASIKASQVGCEQVFDVIFAPINITWDSRVCSKPGCGRGRILLLTTPIY